MSFFPKAEAHGSSEFEASQGFILRHCLKSQIQNRCSDRKERVLCCVVSLCLVVWFLLHCPRGLLYWVKQSFCLSLPVSWFLLQLKTTLMLDSRCCPARRDPPSQTLAPFGSARAPHARLGQRDGRMSSGRRKEEPPQPQLANRALKVSVWSKVLRSDAGWNDKDEFLDVIYWFRQIIAVVLGVIWGILPLRGFLGIAGFCLINARSPVCLLQQLPTDQRGRVRWHMGAHQRRVYDVICLVHGHLDHLLHCHPP